MHMQGFVSKNLLRLCLGTDLMGKPLIFFFFQARFCTSFQRMSFTDSLYHVYFDPGDSHLERSTRNLGNTVTRIPYTCQSGCIVKTPLVYWRKPRERHKEFKYSLPY